MHHCVECGATCDCDWEDFEEPQPADCTHECDLEDDDLLPPELDDRDTDDDRLARECHCGAFQLDQAGHWYQVADCCCPAAF